MRTKRPNCGADCGAEVGGFCCDVVVGPLVGAAVWLSLQGFSRQKAEVVYVYLDRGVPDWFGGMSKGVQQALVVGEMSASDMRAKLDALK